jgi:tyrosyl-tRNA synthetase
MKLSEMLNSRGGVYQFSAPTLAELTDGPKRIVYLGIDPTADSLHIGHLVGIFMLKMFLDAGHQVIIVVGGGTAMIGDPSGKKYERQLLDLAVVRANSKKVAAQIASVFGSKNFKLVNNYDWLKKLDTISFLRDVGKHFTVNSMLAREYVNERVSDESAGISFTEFSYALLQAYDFLYLNQAYGCDVQVGGSDQWGNMISGVDLIRKTSGKSAYVVTCPLTVDSATGEKFGKTVGGAVWLDPNKTSPYEFYQFWLNVSDAQAVEFLKRYTFMPLVKVNEVTALFARNPELRLAQKTLAYEVTKTIHGSTAADAAKATAEVLFGGGDIGTLTSLQLKRVVAELKTRGRVIEVSKSELKIGIPLQQMLVKLTLAGSNSEARRLLSEKGITVNGASEAVDRPLTTTDFKKGIIVLRRGKKEYGCIVVKN